MRYYGSLHHFTTEKATIVSAGKFDGVHKGHQKLLSCARKIAEDLSCETCVFTFITSPQAALSHKKSVSLLENHERKEVIDSFGIDCLVECHFTEAIRNLEPEEFVQNILIDKLHCRGIVVGTDFRFGKNRAGDPDMLSRIGLQKGIRVEIIEKLMDQDREISSTYVREELVKGNMHKVNELLGYSWFAEGEIVHGERNGHLLGFPTANIIPGSRKLLPPSGVYATEIVIDGIRRRSITNIGVRPTLGGEKKTIETNIPGFSGDLYGKRAKVEFLQYVRPETRFESLDALKKQIRSDVKALGF